MAFRLVKYYKSANYRPRPASELSSLLRSALLEKSLPLLTNWGAIYRITEGGSLADGLQELNADKMHVPGVLLTFDSRLYWWHTGGNQR
jgi:hypothetical protein